MQKSFIVAGLLAAMAAVPTNAEIEFKGDLRLRHENIDEEGKDNRQRQRLRLRLGATADVNEHVVAGIRIASGGDDPLSTNQSFDGAGSSKGLRLDRAYLKADLGGATVTGGKMANPFRKTGDLLWDSDLSPEGFALSTGGDLVSFDAGLFAVEENSSGDDIYLYGVQIAVSPSIGEGRSLTVGASYFLYDGIKGSAALYDDDLFGNSGLTVTDADGGAAEVFANDFGLTEGFVIVGVGDTTLYADYVVNGETDSDQDIGFQVGIKQKLGDTKLGYYYRSLEADAVFGTWTDSDFGGGGTDSEGHKFSIEQKLASNVSAGVSLLVNELGLEGDSTDYTRVQVDLKAKF